MLNKNMKKLINPGVFFPAANVCNFSQSGNLIATAIALLNLLASVYLIHTGLADQPPKKNKIIRNELTNPLRVTTYCNFAVTILLLSSALLGSTTALFPGLAALFFGIGVFIQSSVTLSKYRENPKTNSLLKGTLHPAIWFGLGYAMTGINIGGGLEFLTNPLGNIMASALTAIGLIETTGALGLMASNKIKNPAIPFVGVAIGTLFFAATGLLTGNWLGFFTGMFAGAGELSLAHIVNKQYKSALANLG